MNACRLIRSSVRSGRNEKLATHASPPDVPHVGSRSRRNTRGDRRAGPRPQRPGPPGAHRQVQPAVPRAGWFGPRSFGPDVGRGPRGRVEDVPGFGLAVGLALESLGGGVLGVQMHRQHAVRVDELRQQQEHVSAPAAADQLLGVRCREVPQCTARQRPRRALCCCCRRRRCWASTCCHASATDTT